MRIRHLKPGFFKNEDLAELSPWHRICFEGLWCCADREGRMDDRPKRLKAEIFPYDDLDMNGLLWDLTRAGFIVRYAVNLRPLIWIPTWHEHQHPRPDEAKSALPAYEPGTERVNGPHPTTYPATRPADTVPSLDSDEPESAARMGDGRWEMGDGVPATQESPKATPMCRAQDLVDLWNATTKPPIPRCRELTDGRRQKIRARLAKRADLGFWRQVFEAVQASPFCRGENDRGWTADFDWITKNDTNAVKTLERYVSRRVPVEPAWTCPHEPKCGSPGVCDVKRRIDEGKRAAAG